MYTIFINDKPLILISYKTKYFNKKSYRIEEFKNEKIIDISINELKNEKSEGKVILGTNLTKLYKLVLKRFKLIKAAGGIIKHNNSMLWIFKNNKWDLPKGKIDLKESAEKAAYREVLEETGLKYVNVNKHLSSTYHSYLESGEMVLKITYWYSMECKKMSTLKPQVDEGITKVQWIELSNLSSLNTYSSIVELLKQEKVLNFLHF